MALTMQPSEVDQHQQTQKCRKETPRGSKDLLAGLGRLETLANPGAAYGNIVVPFNASGRL
ncbi:MAG: hypothetical protein ACYDBQ_05085 [Thermoplasmatota archaeon]